jgi:hypothetical protein
MNGRPFSSLGRFKVGLIILFFLYPRIYAETKNLEPKIYFNRFFGNIHRSKNPRSDSLKIINCGDFLEEATDEKASTPSQESRLEWKKIRLGPYTGYLKEDFLSPVHPVCFTKKFPKFYEGFNVDPVQNYLWAKLYDQYESGRSKVK